MKMEFIFDEEKLKKEGYTEEQCLDVIRRHFSKLNRNGTIHETHKGFFEGTDDDYGAFGSSVSFTNSNWFLKVIKEWYWYVDEHDGKGEQKEDGLESYYRMTALANR